jgi:hypothetical protein
VRYQVREFIHDFNWALVQYKKMGESGPGFGRFMRSPARWYHELVISLVRKREG